MGLIATSLISFLASTSFALPGATLEPRGAVPAGHHFIAPGPNDVRSPCPGLNSLANHGFIPRNGRNMTIPVLVTGGAAGMNMGADFMTTIGGAGILSNPNPLLDYFDLNNLDEHDFPIEHDGSLSRQDHYFGDWYDFNQGAYNQWISYFGNAKQTSITTASNARYRRINDSLARDPQVAYGPREFILSYGETGLYLQVLGRSTTSGVAPLSYVKDFFTNQRLPYHLGWTKPPPGQEVTLASLAAMAVQLNVANKEQLPEGLQVITLGAFEDAFAGKDPVTGKLANITSGLGL